MACVSTLLQKSLQRGKQRSRPSRFPPLNLFRRCRQPQSDDPTCRGRHQHTPALNVLPFRLGRSTRRHVAFKCNSMMSALLRSVSYYEDIPESFHAPPMSSIVALTPQYSDRSTTMPHMEGPVATGSDKQVGLLFLFFTRCRQHNATLYGLFVCRYVC